ncbi:MAG: hypothetical protein HYW88_00770 [Candidatus Sungbacteria bacterium]|nr:hypothetical protein [Candidatus Sungbacteria bacterium]
MKIFLSSKLTPQKNKAVLVCFFSDEKKGHPYLGTLPPKDAEYLGAVLKHDFTTVQEKFREVHLPSNADHLIVFANLGKKGSWDEKKFTLFTRKTIVYMKDRRIKTISVFLDDCATKTLNHETLLRLFAENALMADCTFSKYKEAPKDGWPEVKEIELVISDAKNAGFAKALNDGNKK